MDISPTKGPLTPTTCKTWGPLRLAVPPLPLGEGCDFDFYPSPLGRGGTARRRGPHALHVVGVRGPLQPSSDFDETLPEFSARGSRSWPLPRPGHGFH